VSIVIPHLLRLKRQMVRCSHFLLYILTRLGVIIDIMIIRNEIQIIKHNKIGERRIKNHHCKVMEKQNKFIPK
jgi:hypothetical protein